MALAALCRQAMPGRPQEVLCSTYFLSYNGIGALYGNNFNTLVGITNCNSIAQNLVDQ